MNEPPDFPEQPDETPVQPEELPPERLVNPNLTGSLVADYEALQNDLVQAKELAADFQQQLAGKANEHAQLKQILEKTQEDLAHLEKGIAELRAERHRLANEAMRAVAYRTKLETVTGERDRLRIDLEVTRAAILERDKRIAEQVLEIVNLRQAADDARQRWIG